MNNVPDLLYSIRLKYNSFIKTFRWMFSRVKRFKNNVLLINGNILSVFVRQHKVVESSFWDQMGIFPERNVDLIFGILAFELKLQKWKKNEEKIGL